MKPTKELILSLTEPQKFIIEKVRAAGRYRRADDQGKALLTRLIELGILLDVPTAGSSLMVVIHNEWANVDLELASREPTKEKQAIRVNGTVLPPVSPDPPKPRVIRPKAEYSNRSHEELINYILKNY